MRDMWKEFVDAHNAKNPQGPYASSVLIVPDSIAGFGQDAVPGNNAFTDFLIALEQAGADVKVLLTTQSSAAFLIDMQDYGLDARIAEFETVSLDRVYGQCVGLMIGDVDLENPQPVMSWDPSDSELQDFVKAVTAENSGYKIVLPEGFQSPKPAPKQAVSAPFPALDLSM